jgi:hypothetical protein
MCFLTWSLKPHKQSAMRTPGHICKGHPAECRKEGRAVRVRSLPSLPNPDHRSVLSQHGSPHTHAPVNLFLLSLPLLASFLCRRELKRLNSCFPDLPEEDVRVLPTRGWILVLTRAVVKGLTSQLFLLLKHIRQISLTPGLRAELF